MTETTKIFLAVLLFTLCCGVLTVVEEHLQRTSVVCSEAGR